MAISQRLVDPSREFKVSFKYSCQESYHAALLENVNALNGLRVLRVDAAAWRERQNLK